LPDAPNDGRFWPDDLLPTSRTSFYGNG